MLDQSPVAERATGAEALRNTLDLARLAEELGYHRYRFAEHHGGPSPAGASPEALIGPIAAATARVRVSSGGVMLPHYSPMTTYALERDRRQAAPDDFPEQLAELLAYLDDRLPADHPFARLARVLPGRPEGPAPWLLGSSAQSGVCAGQLGLPYAFADSINPRGAEIAARYHEEFEPSERLPASRVAVAAWALAADEEEEAQRLAASSPMTLALLHRGRLVPVPPPEKALRFLAASTSPEGPPQPLA